MVNAIRSAIESVCDPEIPVITIVDLGVLRDVHQVGDAVTVTITPTYSGCPAMDTIREDIVVAATTAGAGSVVVNTVLSPAWTTEWMTDEGRLKLAGFGIAPPGANPTCPQCAASDPRTVSEFGSTACKALMVCSSCGEPFDRFKDL